MPKARAQKKTSQKMAALPDLETFMSKLKKMEKGEQLDLSSDEDLSIGIMNLISIEEHFFFTYNKTGKEQYLDLLNEVREMRKTLLKQIIKEYEGEVWCISKHLLSASMRLMEVGTKALTKGDKKAAADFFQKSYHLYSLFWGLNLGAIDSKGMTKAAEQDSQKINFLPETLDKATTETSIFAKMGELVRKAVDCCRE